MKSVRTMTRFLATLSRERRKRKEMREKRRGEALLSQVMVKKLREKLNKRSEGMGGLLKTNHLKQ